MLKNVDNGDVVFFADSNHIVAQDPQVFVDMAIQNGLFLRDHIWIKYPLADWCRRDTFINMGCDSPEFWNAIQLQANIIGVCKNDFTSNFIAEWKDYCLDYHVNFGDQKYKNFPGFVTHRFDQMILSILAQKYHIPYLNRTENVWNEYIIPEIEGIFPSPDRLVDNSYRKDIDSLYNR